MYLISTLTLLSILSGILCLINSSKALFYKTVILTGKYTIFEKPTGDKFARKMPSDFELKLTF